MSDSFLSPLTLIGVGASFAFSSVFYTHYQQKKLEIEKLKEIPSFQVNQHLLKILNASSEKRLHYVAVEGVVQPVGEPLASQYVPRLFGVVQKVTTQEHWKVLNYLGSWVSKTMNAKESSKAVPFQLVQQGSYMDALSVRVESPLESKGDYLEQVHRRFRKAEEGLLETVVQAVSGEKLTAREEREELLRVGTVLTGFGEVVLEPSGSMRLQPPRDGRTFILLPGDHRSFIRRHENTAGMWKGLTALFGITGSTLLAAFVYGALHKDSKSR
ncbi:mitochondrial ubiquitin ligase activator of nfkb 1-A [Salminus brasiliensis]|uniref:mitochondrial ubiquitin ligase activator of nfkb 1-A n=1 Tax=Salminus brasiliensis TaxID=930266 RepID=UPI003B8343D8